MQKFLVFAITLAFLGCAPAGQRLPTEFELLSAGAHEFARMPVGVAVQPALLESDPAYRQTVLREFNSITSENALKMDTVHPERDRFDFSEADALVEFAESNGMRFRAHPLIWHRQLPAWLDSLSPSELEQVFETHLTTLATRYRGRVAAWDVVNEAVLSDGRYRNSVWPKTLGIDYIERAFRLAHLADPEAELFYNDYDIERPGPKFLAVLVLLTELLARGVPVTGVGLQTHLRPSYRVTEAELTEVISQFVALGLTVEITELDYGISLPADEAARSKAAASYEMIARVCSRFVACTGITIWGVNDGTSWVPREIPGTGEATLFDEQYQPKSAYHRFKRALAEGALPQ